MVRVTVWLQLLLVVLILRQSAAVSDQCSKQQEEISRLYGEILKIRDLKNVIQLGADNCHEDLRKQVLISQATSKELNKTVAVNSDLKKQLEVKEEVLKYNNETQIQLQTNIDVLTKTVQSQYQTIQGLRETAEHVCRHLLKAAKSGDVNTVKILIKCSNDNCTSYEGHRFTPLIYAAKYGHVEVVRVLLEGGVNVDRGNAEQDTALHYAAIQGRLDMCRLLLDWGAKVDRLNRWKITPLHFAARQGHLSVVKLLVERGADVSVENFDGRTASDLARLYEQKDVADWLDNVRHG